MTITLKFYGQLRDVTKQAETQFQVKERATVSELAETLAQEFPKLREHLKSVSFAVDSEYASKETVLQEGNEVGVLPPISGGRDG